MARVAHGFHCHPNRPKARSFHVWYFARLSRRRGVAARRSASGCTPGASRSSSAYNAGQCIYTKQQARPHADSQPQPRQTGPAKKTRQMPPAEPFLTSMTLPSTAVNCGHNRRLPPQRTPCQRKKSGTRMGPTAHTNMGSSSPFMPRNIEPNVHTHTPSHNPRPTCLRISRGQRASRHKTSPSKFRPAVPSSTYRWQDIGKRRKHACCPKRNVVTKKKERRKEKKRVPSSGASWQRAEILRLCYPSECPSFRSISKTICLPASSGWHMQILTVPLDVSPASNDCPLGPYVCCDWRALPPVGPRMP